MQYQSITTDAELHEYCRHLAGADLIAFDTEFVSEDTFRPQLCLIQVAAAGGLAVIDSLAVSDLTPFWEVLARPGHETVVHAGREELRFSLDAIGQRPHALFDVQLAAGLIGLEYPASYATLVNRLLGKSVQKGETRTNWRARPLSSRQLDYALQDVIHLRDLRDELETRLARMNRRSWLSDEMQSWQERVEHAENSERWRRVSGLSGISRQGLAIVRELWRWRESEAQARNCPPRRVLRDDLLVELAKRQTADPKRIRAVRGLEHRHLQRSLPQISERIEQALKLPERDWPAKPQRHSRPPMILLGQFLSVALSSICRAMDLSPAIVGTADDVRELIAYHLGMTTGDDGQPPLLARGWRAEVVGSKIEELLDGKLALRIARPLSEQPLEFLLPAQRGANAEPPDRSPES
ncbi:MAG: ribonuclease D [Pirellulaceae bacterium]|nr:ribonuclease D [Pirellulaceae bacterium]